MSVYGDILADVKSLSGISPFAGNVIIRKSPIVLKADTLPLLLICPAFQFDSEEAFEGKIILDYKVLIVLVFAGNQTWETGLSTMFDAAQAIRHAVHVTVLSTATTVFDSSIKLNPAFDDAALLKNYDWHAIELTYRSSESRNS